MQNRRSQLALALVVLGVLALAVPGRGEAATVTATFTYTDTNPATGVQTDRPIVGAKVEIWRFRNRVWPGIWAWGMDAETTTDAPGSINVPIPFVEKGVVYALRVYATNDAAIVWPNDAVHTMPFHREPGDDDDARIQLTENAASDVLDFSYTFHGGRPSTSTSQRSRAWERHMPTRAGIPGRPTPSRRRTSSPRP